MKNFTEIFNKIAFRHDFMRAFDDFLTLSITALSFGRMEQQYQDTIKVYTKEEIILFGQLLGALVLDYENHSTDCGGWYDGLGDFFMENNSKFGQDAKGQFFTPEPVCNMIAQMTTTDEGQKENNILDPAVGSGRMLIAFDRINPKNRFNNFYIGGDIDRRCVKICTLNMYLYGMKGAVIHMDSLKMEIWGGYRVYLPDTGLGIRPLDKNECLKFILQSQKEDTKPIPEPIQILEPFKIDHDLKPEKAFQLSLF
jgi:type I restriction enzyme M protein